MITTSAGFAVMAAVAAWGYRRRFLTLSGAVAACVVGGLVWAGGRWGLAVPLVFFFVLSSVLTRWAAKKTGHVKKPAAEKTARDGWQVAANGTVPALCALAAYLTGQDWWLYGGLCALAAMTGDTWSSEIGRALASRPLDLRRMRRVEAGISGAVSLVGTLAGLAGAVLTTLVGVALLPALGRPPLEIVLAISGWAFLAGWVDSILGASIQLRYRCAVCGKLTDHRVHCGAPAIKVAGIPGIDNSMVNFLTTIFAGTAALLVRGW